LVADRTADLFLDEPGERAGAVFGIQRVLREPHDRLFAQLDLDIARGEQETKVVDGAENDVTHHPGRQRIEGDPGIKTVSELRREGLFPGTVVIRPRSPVEAGP